jgi:site-specific DNA recombinase
VALLRAVIYCRCSTEEESQVDALRNQIIESEACVKEQGWILTDKYVESKSGTTTRGRAEYNRLFEDLLSDKFDIIVIKSQDRLMRNVKDWYLFLDRMLSHGKRLFMYLDRKFYTTDDSLITGIKAILAEEYSRELSKKINNAHRHRQLNGGKAMLTSRVFGFLKMPDGSVSVVVEEADIIKKIYGYCAAGYGSRTIANILLNEGYKKKDGTALTSTSIGRMIRNPIYKGIVVMNRLHYDFETKRTIKMPKEEWVYGTDIVPAIVSEELWEQANIAMTERAERFHRNGIYIKGSSPGKYDLSGKIVCGQCGNPYYRTRRRGYANKDEIVIEWKCSTYLEKGRRNKNRSDNLRKIAKEFKNGCDNVHLEEKVLFSLLEQVSSQYFDFKNQDADSIINHAIRILRKALKEKKSDYEWERLEDEEKSAIRQKELLLTKLLDGVISDSDYGKRNGQLEEKLSNLRIQKNKLKQKEWEIKNLEQRIEKIKNRLEKGGVERATVSNMLEDIKQITVHEWHLDITFDPLKIIEFSENRPDRTIMALEKEFTISIKYPFSPKTERGRYLDKEMILKIMRENPDTSAKKIAVQMERPLKIVQNRIKELRIEGYIRFKGKGGHGIWEVQD